MKQAGGKPTVFLTRWEWFMGFLGLLLLAVAAYAVKRGS